MGVDDAPAGGEMKESLHASKESLHASLELGVLLPAARAAERKTAAARPAPTPREATSPRPSAFWSVAPPPEAGPRARARDEALLRSRSSVPFDGGAVDSETPPWADEEYPDADDPGPARAVLLDAWREGGFRGRIFWRQFVLHWLYPFSLAWYPKKAWPHGARAQRLIQPRGGTHILGVRMPSVMAPVMHCLPMCTLALLAIFCAFPKRFAEQGVGFDEAVLMPTFLALTRSVMIGVKYATLTQQEYRAFFREMDTAVTDRWSDQVQLINGWLTKREDVFANEIFGAAKKVNVDTSRLVFVFEHSRFLVCGGGTTLAPPARAWRDFLGAARLEGEDCAACEIVEGRLYYHAHALLLNLLRTSRRKAPNVRLSIVLALSTLIACVPRCIAVASRGDAAAFLGAVTGPALLRGDYAQVDWLVFFCMQTAWFITQASCAFYLLVMLACARTYFFQFLIMRWLTLLARASFDTAPGFPQIEFMKDTSSAATNVVAWVHCHAIAAHFGRRYTTRLTVYMAMIGAFLVSFALAIFLMILKETGGADDDDGGKAIAGLRDSSFVWSASLLLGIYAASLCTSVFYASATNDENQKAAENFAQHRLQLHAFEAPHAFGTPRALEAQSRAPSSRSDLSAASDGFSSPRSTPNAEARLAFDEKLQLASEHLGTRVGVVRLLGIPADFSLLLSLLTTLATFFAYVGYNLLVPTIVNL